MTKKDLIDQLNQLANKVSDEIDDTRSHLRSLEHIQGMLEELPSEPDEIEDDSEDPKEE